MKITTVQLQVQSVTDHCYSPYTGSANENFAEFAVERLESFVINVSTIAHHLQSNNPGGVADRIILRYITHFIELVDVLQSLLRRWQDYLAHYQSRSVSSYNAHIVRTSLPGRPRFEITRAQIQYLRSMSFSWVQISRILGVSYTTVYRRRIEFGIPNTSGMTITDHNLHECLCQMRSEYPAQQSGED